MPHEFKSFTSSSYSLEEAIKFVERNFLKDESQCKVIFVIGAGFDYIDEKNFTFKVGEKEKLINNCFQFNIYNSVD